MKSQERESMRLYTDLYRTGGWTAVQKERRKKEKRAERERERSHLGNLKVKAQRAKEARALVLNSVERKPPPLPREETGVLSVLIDEHQPTTNN